MPPRVLRATLLTDGMLGMTKPVPIQPLRTSQTLDQEKFLELLNFRDATPPIHGGGPQRVAWAMSAQASIAGHLRAWIDEWLESGRANNGSETPTNRTFELAQKASEAANSYSKMGRGRLLGVQNRLELWFDLYGENKVSVGGFSRIAPRAETIAAEKLVMFLLSELRNRLAKCRNRECGRYFVLSHWNRTYRKGTFCAECQRERSLKSAAKATAAERSTAEGELRRMAATHFRAQIVGNANWHKDAKMKDQISRYLTARIGRSASLSRAYPAGVSGKWVARHSNWSALETAAKKGD